MRRCKQNSKHANMPPSLHRIQQPLYSSAFYFFLGLSHFILIPPVCFFYHLSFCVFLSLLPICACLLLPSLFCFVYLSLSDLSSGKSSLHLDSQSLMGAASGTNTSEGQEKCFILGKILLKESEKITKESKG